MSGVLVAVQGCTISVLPPVVGGTITVTTPPSAKLKFENKGVYAGPVDVLVTGTALGALAQASPVTITINPSVIKKCKADGNLMLGVGDTGMTSSPVTFNAGPASSSSVIQIMITDAGQSKAMAI